ncbi:hypothetical protein ANCCEY_07350 [Ancylostoma ceylanicum]|uniref:FHA domain-containing protein n=1 Tax=Ancylostoma ceylanicum TaxID=53326 RepID=A0A0D6M0Z9_9BILA|nr:hypothetical protein ANCCEY_07350 [Ancylostoma ceylanicum]
MISRDHADIIGVKGASGRIEKYHINDRSLNGTYINDQRVNSTMQIMEGDVIKFGHMNGAAANAEFAFMVERANPSYDYIGFVDGRRVRPVTCSGDTEYCTEIEGRTIDHIFFYPDACVHVLQLNAPCTTASVSSTAGTNPMAGLVWPGALGYNQSIPGFPYSGFPVNPAYLQHPQWAQQLQMLSQQAVHSQQQSGFRVPDVFGATACMSSSNGPPSTSASLFPLTQRGFALQNNALVNSLLTPATPAANQQQSQQQIHHQQQLTQQNSDSTPAAKIPVASPPMECDSSVPSPPKTSVASTSTASTALPPARTISSPLRKEEDLRSERSFADSPQPPRAPAPAPWDSTPSPRPRDYSPDRETLIGNCNALEILFCWTNFNSEATTCVFADLETAMIVSKYICLIVFEKFPLKIEKMRKKERSREQRASLASSSSVSSLTASSKPGRRRLKQLSDDSSSSESSSDSDQTPPTSRKTVTVEKKKTDTKKKTAAKVASDVSSSRSTDSDYDSDEHVTTKKGHKRRYSSSEKLNDKKKTSTPNSSASASKKKGKTAGRKRQDPETEEDESVTQHDPQTTCALNDECTKPQNEQVGWIFCDDCQNWFHNICILGREEAPDDEFFYCGCKAKKKTKKR